MREPSEEERQVGEAEFQVERLLELRLSGILRGAFEDVEEAMGSKGFHLFISRK